MAVRSRSLGRGTLTSAMPAKAKQHFVPDCYLQAWTDPGTPTGQEPYVWVFPIEGREGRRKSPSNIYWRRDFYTRSGKDGERDVGLEDLLARLEGLFVEVRDRTLALGRPLPDYERSTLCLFVAAMRSRTEVREQFEQEIWGTMLRHAEREGEGRPDAPAKLELRTPSGDHEITFESIRAHLLRPMPDILLSDIRTQHPALMQMDLAVLETDDPLGFVTSDHPCVWSGTEQYPGGGIRPPGLMQRSIEVLLPISPRQVVLLNRRGNSGYRKVPLPFVDRINHNILVGAGKSFIVNHDRTKDEWFVDPTTGTSPGP